MSHSIYDRPSTYHRSGSDSSINMHHLSNLHSPLMATSGNSLVTTEIHKGQWTAEEDEILRDLTSRLNARRTPCDDSECSNRCSEGVCAHATCTDSFCHHSRCTKGNCQGRHSIREIVHRHSSLVMVPLDHTLCAHSMNTEKRWTEIAAGVTKRGGRSRNAKQCRERWHQQVRPGLLHSPITEQEGQMILQLVQEMGTKWADISRVPELQRRSDNCIKNWYNSSQNKRGRHIAAAEPPSRAPASPRGVHKVPAQRSNHRNDASQQRLYEYAVENGRQRVPEGPFHVAADNRRPIEQFPTTLPPIRSPPVTESRHSPADVAMLNAPDYPHPDSFGYFPRRRESNASIMTKESIRTNNSGPPTPSTSRSLMFSQEPGTSPGKHALHGLQPIDTNVGAAPSRHYEASYSADSRRVDRLPLSGLLHHSSHEHKPSFTDINRNRMAVQALCN